MVLRPTPNALALSATVTSRASYRARATATCAGESLAGRPPRRPRACAAARLGCRPLSDELPLELGQRGEDMEDQAAGLVARPTPGQSPASLRS